MTSDLIEDQLRGALDDAVSHLPLAHPLHPRDRGADGLDMYLIEHSEGGSKEVVGGRHLGRRPLVISGVAVAAVATVAVLTIVPSTSSRPPAAASTQLRRIATMAAVQPSPQLGANQLELNSVTASVQITLENSDTSVTPASNGTGTVHNNESGSIPGAVATVLGSVKEWSNATGGSCILATYGSPQFASAANQAAWLANVGQRPSNIPAPTGQDGGPATFCDESAANAGLGATAGVIDVSTLSTDPSVLAQQLTASSTGIPELDLSTGAPSEDLGFERAIVLLAAPTVGGTPTFRSALYQAMALLPGIRSVGSVTTQTGETGAGFSGTTAQGPAEVVVDPNTGDFLELSGIGSKILFESLVPDIGLSLSNGPLGFDGADYSFQVLWVDQAMEPTIVSASSLPVGTIVPSS